MATGLFGGTFNPFHNGHLGVMRHVKTALHLDRIILFPCANPPHKPLENLAPDQDRLEIITASIHGLEDFLVSDIELRRGGISFTIDTIKEFERIYSDELLLMVGSDSFLGMDSWQSSQNIFQKVSVIVMPRDTQRELSLFSDFIDEHLSTEYTWKQDRFVHETMKEIIVCPVPRIDISSTMIRDRIKKGQPIHDLVPRAAAEIIEKKELYQ